MSVLVKVSRHIPDTPTSYADEQNSFARRRRYDVCSATNNNTSGQCVKEWFVAESFLFLSS